MAVTNSTHHTILKWVLIVTVPRTVLDATASVLTRLGNAAAQLVLRTQPRRAALRTASVRQDQRKYCVLVLRTHPVGSVVMKEHSRDKEVQIYDYTLRSFPRGSQSSPYDGSIIRTELCESQSDGCPSIYDGTDGRL